MGIRCKDPFMVKKYFESRFKLLAQIWAWFMRRRGYTINYVTTHLEKPKYLVRAYLVRPREEAKQ